jgi:ElaB/YqjD/DUF883 family membrane-anchored ribosome-binding protein
MESDTMYGNTNAGLATDTTTASAGIAARHQETMDQLNRTVAQAEDLLRALGNESGEAIDAMRARVSSTLRDARARLSSGAGQARNFANTTLSQADAYVHANPWRAVAIGAGIGVLLAMMMTSRRRHTVDGEGSADY